MTKSIGAAEFKAQCLSLIDEIGEEGLIITKRGKPVARLVPFGIPSRESIGLLKGKLKIHGDVMSTGLRWDAES